MKYTIDIVDFCNKTHYLVINSTNNTIVSSWLDRYTAMSVIRELNRRESATRFIERQHTSKGVSHE